MNEKELCEDWFDSFAIDQAMRISSKSDENEDEILFLSSLCDDDEIIMNSELWKNC